MNVRAYGSAMGIGLIAVGRDLAKACIYMKKADSATRKGSDVYCNAGTLLLIFVRASS